MVYITGLVTRDRHLWRAVELFFFFLSKYAYLLLVYITHIHPPCIFFFAKYLCCAIRFDSVFMGKQVTIVLKFMIQ